MEETKQKKLSQPFVPIPVSFLNEMIANETAPLSHRVLAVILRQMFDTRKKEQDKLTVSYIAKTLKNKDRRDIRKVVESLCKVYPFYIENNGSGRANKIILQTCGKNATGEPVGKTPQAPVGKTPQAPVGKMPQAPVGKMPHTIEDRIDDSIEKKRIIEITGDEWC